MQRQRWIREIWKFACGRKLRSMNVVDGECFGRAAAGNKKKKHNTNKQNKHWWLRYNGVFCWEILFPRIRADDVLTHNIRLNPAEGQTDSNSLPLCKHRWRCSRSMADIWLPASLMQNKLDPQRPKRSGARHHRTPLEDLPPWPEGISEEISLWILEIKTLAQMWKPCFVLACFPFYQQSASLQEYCLVCGWK